MTVKGEELHFITNIFFLLNFKYKGEKPSVNGPRKLLIIKEGFGFQRKRSFSNSIREMGRVALVAHIIIYRFSQLICKREGAQDFKMNI